MDLNICDSAGNAIIINGVLIDELIFPIELDPINKWVYSYVKSAKDNINEEFLNLIVDLVKYYGEGNAKYRETITAGFKGMWVFLDTYAKCPDAKIFENIVANLSLILSNVNLMANVDVNCINPIITDENVTNDNINNVNNDSSANTKRKSKRANVEENSDGFIKPMKTAKVINSNVKNPVLLKNSYENLVDMSEDNNNDDNNVNNKRKDPRPEPIHLKVTENWREISNKVDEITKTKIAKIFQGDCIKFIPKTIDQYRAIQNFFAQQKLEFFGLKLKNERPRKVLLKGIPTDVNIQEIKDELTSKNFNIHRVAQLRNFKTKNPMPIFMVDIFPDDEFKNIFDIRTVLGFLVKVEIYKFKGARQCYNCQRFNHSSEVCKFKPVCVKCSGGHRANQCPIKPDDRNSIKCANCSGNHTANFGGCPKNPKNIQNSRTVTIKDSPMTFTSSRVKENLSFASMAKGTPLPPIAKTKNNSKIITSKISDNVILANKNINENMENSCAQPEQNVQNADNKHNLDLITNIIHNNIDIDSLIEKLNKLYNIFNKLSQILKVAGMEALVKNLGADSSSGILSSLNNSKIK